MPHECSQQPTSEMTRRVLLRGTAMTGLAAPLLAACGSDGGEADSASSDAASGPASGQPLTSTADVPVGGGTVLKEEQIVVTQPTEGEFKAFTAVCTHSQCTVANVMKGTINCDCHGSKYDAATGEVTGGPAPSPLAAISVKVEGDQIVTA